MAQHTMHGFGAIDEYGYQQHADVLSMSNTGFSFRISNLLSEGGAAAATAVSAGHHSYPSEPVHYRRQSSSQSGFDFDAPRRESTGYSHRDSICSVQSAATGTSASSVSTSVSVKQELLPSSFRGFNIGSPETPPEQSTGPDENLTDSAMREGGGKTELKRMKNREAAARCRYRRKKLLGDLQDQVDQLASEKAALEKQKNDRISELQTQVERLCAEKEEQQRRIEMLTKILTSIKSGSGY